jgi:hypothetical protein
MPLMVSDWPCVSLSRDTNEDAIGSQSSQNAQDRIEIRCEQIPLDPAQVAPLDLRRSREFELGLTLTKTHRSDRRSKGQG